MRRRLILGITGGVASGKTTVMRELARAGIPTISSDELSHRCIRKGRPAYRDILRVFGRSILRSDRQIDRAALGRLVFKDPRQRRRLERIVHPCVVKALRRFIRRHYGVIALDIPLLFEAHMEKRVDKIVVVYCRREQQLARLRDRSLSRAEAARRIDAQISLQKKRAWADWVIENTGDFRHLYKEVAHFKNDLTKLRRGV